MQSASIPPGDSFIEERRKPPEYCQYADGPCDQTFESVARSDVLFLYGSNPPEIAASVEAALASASQSGQGAGWRSWRDLPIPGQIIFTEVCKAMRFAGTIVADVTTLNFNLLFEIGFAIGLGLPLIPIRDTTYVADSRAFEELDVLQTLGYVDFTNGPNLLEALQRKLPAQPLTRIEQELAVEAPLYVVKGAVETQGTIQLLSDIKKSRIKFRAYDPVEVPRLSLSEARRQVARSVGLIAPLLSPHREGSKVHNGLCAFLAGLAMAQGKIVLMLQEGGDVPQPIDYRDVVKTYSHPKHILGLIEGPILQIYEEIQKRQRAGKPRATGILHELDLGDPAAENETAGLADYFVETGQYLQARQGHARLVVGRKGSGKTALFYGIRDPLIGSPSRLIADLRPEGFQFTKLKEVVLGRMSPGVQDHTMTAFWQFLLYSELARKILVSDRSFAMRDPGRTDRYQRVAGAYRNHAPNFDADFSTRLMDEVDRIVERLNGVSVPEVGPRLTELIFTGDLGALEEAVADYLRDKTEVWLLIDNLDKGWPTHGASREDILIVRALLEATRKLQHRLERERVLLKCLVFLRSDIYERLLEETPDKGKDTAIVLEWDDPRMFEELVKLRIEASTSLGGTFGEVWPEVFESLIKVQDTFDYLVARTLMRPRDLLMFVRRCVDVAVNMGHEKVLVDDILVAEPRYSEDLLFWVSSEIADTYPQWQDVLLAFHGKPRRMGWEELLGILAEAGVDTDDTEAATNMLLQFGFLGVSSVNADTVMYAHQWNTRRLWYPVRQGTGLFVIHPAFHAALDVGA